MYNSILIIINQDKVYDVRDISGDIRFVQKKIMVILLMSIINMVLYEMDKIMYFVRR